MTFLWRLYNMFISYLSYPKLLLQTMLLFVWWVGHGGCAVPCRDHHDVWPNCSALETCVSFMWIFALLLFLCLAELHFFSSELCQLGIIADTSTIGGGALGGLVMHPCHWASCPHWVSISHPGLFCIFFFCFPGQRMVCYTIHFSLEHLKREVRILGSDLISMDK